MASAGLFWSSQSPCSNPAIGLGAAGVLVGRGVRVGPGVRVGVGSGVEAGNGRGVKVGAGVFVGGAGVSVGAGVSGGTGVNVSLGGAVVTVGRAVAAGVSVAVGNGSAPGTGCGDVQAAVAGTRNRATVASRTTSNRPRFAFITDLHTPSAHHSIAAARATVALATRPALR